MGIKDNNDWAMRGWRLGYGKTVIGLQEDKGWAMEVKVRR